MIDNSSIDSHSNIEERSNPIKNIMNNLKKLIKKNEDDKKPLSFEASRTQKGPDSDTLKYEAYKRREAKRAMRERRANSNEQKLPAKFKKGW